MRILYYKLSAYLQKQGLRFSGGHHPETGPVTVFTARRSQDAAPPDGWQDRLREYLFTQGARLDMVRETDPGEWQIQAEDAEIPPAAHILRAASEVGAALVVVDRLEKGDPLAKVLQAAARERLAELRAALAPIQKP